MTDPAAPAVECPHCGEVIESGEDFCRACGHSLDFGERVSGSELGDDHNAGDICPSCGATHMVRRLSGQFVCETCGYER